MASKQPLKLFDLKLMGVKAWLKTKYFIKHTLLMQKKNMLIIGDDKSDFYRKLSQRLSSGWSIQTINQSTYWQNGQQDLVNKYINAESQLKKVNYEAIVVLPETQNKENTFNFQDEGLVTKFPNMLLNSTIRNLFAYKMASKYLSRTGIIILSCNEKQFYSMKPLESEQHGRGRRKIQLKQNPYKQYAISHCLSDGAISYLGLIIGDRYELSLTSHSVIALSSEQSLSQQDLISKFYADWVNRRNLPEPGSFARFIGPSEQVQSYFVEYL